MKSSLFSWLQIISRILEILVWLPCQGERPFSNVAFSMSPLHGYKNRIDIFQNLPTNKVSTGLAGTFYLRYCSSRMNASHWTFRFVQIIPRSKTFHAHDAYNLPLSILSAYLHFRRFFATSNVPLKHARYSLSTEYAHLHTFGCKCKLATSYWSGLSSPQHASQTRVCRYLTAGRSTLPKLSLECLIVLATKTTKPIRS